MPSSASSWIISEGYAGLHAQALGLAEAAGLKPDWRVLTPRAPWRYVPARFWPAPLQGVGIAPAHAPDLVIGCGGVAAAVGSALRKDGRRVVQVQNPRMPIHRFDVVVANRHDELTGPNVIVTRTALHRATPARLHEAAQQWRDRLAHLPRPWVAVLVGGSNGRFRLDKPVGMALAGQLAQMMKRDKVGVALTTSRRTEPEVRHMLANVLTPMGGWVWDTTGDNPYYGLLALADMIVVTTDSVSMASEAVATSAPVMLASLPGRSRRIGLFTQGLLQDGRARVFEGRFDHWPTDRLDDTAEAAAEMCRRLNI